MPKTATVKKATKAAPKAAAKKPAAKTTKTAVKAPVKSKIVAKAAAKPVKKPANTSVKPSAKPAAKVTKITKTAPAAVKPVVKAAPAAVKAPAAPVAKAPKNDNNAYDYKAGDRVVYPAHGVGRVEGVEKLVVAGIEVTLYTITFEKDRMRLKLPLQKVQTSGLRRLANKEQMDEVYQTMKGRARIRRVMWSRRAQEYEAKINSGSPVQVAEVLRDLRRNVSSTEHSYSERQIFQQALERLASELAAIDNIAEDAAAQKLQTILADAA